MKILGKSVVSAQAFYPSSFLLTAPISQKIMHQS